MATMSFHTGLVSSIHTVDELAYATRSLCVPRIQQIQLDTFRVSLADNTKFNENEIGSHPIAGRIIISPNEVFGDIMVLASPPHPRPPRPPRPCPAHRP